MGTMAPRSGRVLQLAAVAVGVALLLGGWFVAARLSSRLDVLSSGLASKRQHIETITSIRRDARKTYVALLLHWLVEPTAAQSEEVRKKAAAVLAMAERFASSAGTSPQEEQQRDLLLGKLSVWQRDLDQATRTSRADANPLHQQQNIDGIDRIAEDILAMNSAAAAADDKALAALRRTQNAVWIGIAAVVLLLAAGAWYWRVKTAAAERVATARLEKEMEIAATIQTSLLPPGIAIDGLDVSAAMLPASEVGGDYYDVIPRPGGCWVAIGDVAGHGLTAGLVMMQVQSAVATLLSKHPDARPSEVLAQVNGVIYDNVRNRMKRDEHMTISLLRYDDDGRVVVAGAHEDLVIFRAGSKTCETVETRGTWIGMMRSVERHMVETEFRLDPGDVLVLYTDGITEARNGKREQFGLERLTESVARSGDGDARTIRDSLIDAAKAWMVEQDDDVTVMVLRYLGSGASAAAAE